MVGEIVYCDFSYVDDSRVDDVEKIEFRIADDKIDA